MRAARGLQVAASALLGLALLASIGTARPAFAQAFDLRSLIPKEGPRERAEKERLQRVADQKRVCDRIKAWFDEGPLNLTPGHISQAEQNAAVLQLLEDGRFTRAFGKPYGQMSAAELSAAAKGVVPGCFDPKGPLKGYHLEIRSVAYAALDPQRRPTTMRQLAATRGATSALQALTDELQELPVSEKGYARLAAIRQGSEAALKAADAGTVTEFEHTLVNTEIRVAAPMQTALVRDAIAASNGYEGLAQLARLSAELQRRSPPSVALREHLLQLHVRMEQIGSAVLESERPRIDALGDGLTGLENGVAWQTTFDARGAPYIGTVQPIEDLQAYFIRRRRAVLDSAQSEFAAIVRRAVDPTELGTLQRRYLLESDRATPSGAQLLSVIADQRHDLAAANGFGASRMTERGEPVPGELTSFVSTEPSMPLAADSSRVDTPASRTAPRAALAPVDLSGEPAEDVMFDLVRTRYENEIERLRRVSTRCASGRSGDTLACGTAPGIGDSGTDAPLRITAFRKRGCSSVSGRPGYVCEFEYTVAGGPKKIVGAITSNLGGDDGVAAARFAPRDGDWVMITAH